MSKLTKTEYSEPEKPEHDTPECPFCGSNRTRPLDDTVATCFDCEREWLTI